jgi:NTE family protein
LHKIPSGQQGPLRYNNTKLFWFRSFLKICKSDVFKYSKQEKRTISTQKKLKIGLALGGGGARGFAHLGVIRALQKHQISFDVMSGTSIGAIIAVAYLQKKTFDRSARTLKEFAIRYSNRFKETAMLDENSKRKTSFGSFVDYVSQRFKVAQLFTREFIAEAKLLEEICSEFIHPCNLEDLPIPVYISALDIISGQGWFINKGNAQLAVQASMSIPGYFPGVKLDNAHLCDPHNLYPVPIQPMLDAQVDVIIACDVGLDIETNYHPSNAFDILFRQSDLMLSHTRAEVYHCSDVVIRPEISRYHWSHFDHMEYFLRKGMEAGEKAVPAIMDVLQHPKKRIPLKDRPWHDFGFKNTPRYLIKSIQPIERS